MSLIARSRYCTADLNIIETEVGELLLQSLTFLSLPRVKDIENKLDVKFLLYQVCHLTEIFNNLTMTVLPKVAVIVRVYDI